MSEENVELVRRVWDAADRRDSEAVLALYHPDVELDVSAFPMVATEEGVYRGHDGLRRLFAQWREIWDDATSELIEVIEAGGHVATVYTYRGRGRVSGLPVEEEFATLWTVRNGQVVRVRWFTGREAALEAAAIPGA